MKISLDNVRFSYQPHNPILKGISFDIDPGKCTALIGPNASGKSTLLKCLAGILKAQGDIFLQEKNYRQLKKNELVKSVGFLPQDNNSRAMITVYEMLLLGRLQSLTWKVSPEDHEITERMIDDIGIRHLATRYLSELSGGQRQLVSFAQTLVREPSILLLDEPTNSLDLQHELEILETVKTIVKKRGITTLITLHDLGLAARFSDRLIVLKDGEIVADGEPNEVLTEELLRTVYGVKAKITQIDGTLQILPISSIQKKDSDLHM